MLSNMIADLKAGHLPEPVALRGRLRAALVKKLAMLRLDRSFRHNDHKINPNCQHILWAAIILEDDQSLALALDILLTEALEGAQAALKDHATPAPNQQQLLQQNCQALLALPLPANLTRAIRQKVKKVSAQLTTPQRRKP